MKLVMSRQSFTEETMLIKLYPASPTRLQRAYVYSAS